jgi:hypothetical protein
MKKRKAVDLFADAMYSLVAEIERSDYSDLDARWAKLASAIRELPMAYDKKKDLNASASQLLRSMHERYGYVQAELVAVCEALEDATDVGSCESVSEDKAREMREAAAAFEIKFEGFVEELEAIYPV